jgi:hypothetical protein
MKSNSVEKAKYKVASIQNVGEIYLPGGNNAFIEAVVRQWK